MSVFGCFCKSPNTLKDKQTNKYPFDSLAAQSITLPHASGPFLQELMSSFQPVLSEMNKTLGDTKEWNGVTEIWNHRSICLNLIIRIAGKSTHQKNWEDQLYSLLKNKVLCSFLPSQTEHSQISLEVSFSAKWEFLFKKSMVTGSYFLA